MSIRAPSLSKSAILPTLITGLKSPCSNKLPPPHKDLFEKLGSSAALALGTGNYQQSVEDYPTSGEFIDYAYGAHQTLAFTFEISKKMRPKPPSLRYHLQRSVAATLSFLKTLSSIHLDSYIPTKTVYINSLSQSQFITPTAKLFKIAR